MRQLDRHSSENSILISYHLRFFWLWIAHLISSFYEEGGGDVESLGGAHRPVAAQVEAVEEDCALAPSPHVEESILDRGGDSDCSLVHGGHSCGSGVSLEPGQTVKKGKKCNGLKM